MKRSRNLQSKGISKKFQSSSMLLIILIIICIVTLVLSIILFYYLSNTSRQIENLSIEYVKSNSINTVTYLKEILQNKILTVSSNLYVLSSIPLIAQQNLSAISNLEAAQHTTSDLTEGYGWINESGMGLWSTTFSENKTTRDQFSNLNASQRPYFLVPKETFKPFVTDAFITPNYNQVPRIVISYPILSLKSNASLLSSNDIANNQSYISSYIRQSNNLDTNFLKKNFDFRGIITASINAATIDRYFNHNVFRYTVNLNDNNIGSKGVNEPTANSSSSSPYPSNELLYIKYSNIQDPTSPLFTSITNSSSFTSSSPSLSQSSLTGVSPRPNLLLTDNSGVILYSSDERIKTGSSYVSPQNLQIIESGYDPDTSNFLISVLNNLSNNKDESYSGTLELVNNQGDKSIINFEPILLNGKHILYLSTNTNFVSSDTANALISSQIMFTFIFIGTLLLMVFSFIATVLFINRKLKYEVKNKTVQLQDNILTLEKANERLIESEQTEREFINTAAHELRTPTQAITGYSELVYELFEELKKNKKNMTKEELERVMIDQISKYHDNITRNASRLDKLINNLLDVARIESNKDNMLMIHKERVDLIKEIKDVVETQLGQKLADKNIKINFINEIFDEDYFVYVDKSRLNQILNNLLENAIKFSPTNSSIDIIIKENDKEIDGQSCLHEEARIDVRSQDKENLISKDDGNIMPNVLKKNNTKNLPKKEVFVAISDSGKGISPDILPKLFEKFVTNSDSGTGLGLFITKKLVEVMGGRIWAYNNKDGIGSTFIFSLTKNDNGS